jgi:hypothetical protein
VVFGVGISATGPLGTADAPLASDNDKPAAPKTGRALLRRLRFEACFVCDMAESFHSGNGRTKRSNARPSDRFQHAPASDLLSTLEVCGSGVEFTNGKRPGVRLKA